MANTAYIGMKRTQSSLTNWAINTYRYFAFDQTLMDCEEVKAYLRGLDNPLLISQLIALTTANEPVSPTGSWGERNCADAGGDIIVIADNSGFPGELPSGDGFDFSYNPTLPQGQDFAGNVFVRTAAPMLTNVSRIKPATNNYAFIPQSALNVALFRRIPPFSVLGVSIYPGGFYNGAGNNEFIGRGFTHVSESPKVPDAVYPTGFKRAVELANYAAAKQAADSLPNGDARKQKLIDWASTHPAFEGEHLLIDDESVAQIYGQFWYQLFKQDDWKGGGVEYFSVNHEVFKSRNNGKSNYQQQYEHNGMVTKAILDAAAADGNTSLKSALTDFGNLSHTLPFNFDDTDSETGYPRYMSVGYIHEPFRGGSQADPIGNGTILGQLVRAGKAFTGVGRYVQHTSDGQSLFEKNPNGTLKVVGGEAVWRTDKRSAVITGQTTVIYKDDNFNAMLKRYGFEASNYANDFFRAGSAHLPSTGQRKSGYENIRFAEQFRLDTESDTGNTLLAPGYATLTQAEFDMLNSRPLNPDWTEGNAIRMYIEGWYRRGWMETQLQTTLGSDTGKSSKARASVEIYQKGFQRAANFNWLLEMDTQRIEPRLWIKNQGVVSAANPDEAFYRKPIIRGRFGVSGGKRFLFFRGEWPCQDESHNADVTIWVNTGSVTSPGYKITLEGRKTFLGYWFLPDDFASFEAKHVYLQFDSLLGEKITWRGDYREAKITSHPTPPALA